VLSGIDRARWLRVVDLVAVGVAVTLPWSTTATRIFIALWVLPRSGANGLVGVAVLLAMWIVHLLLFVRGAGLTAWIGTIVVVQNVVASLFNSHLFDFTSGWLYVFGVGVGVAGGMVLRQRDCA
jgi:hypothetical protein